MGHQLLLHDEVREWLTVLRETEPEQARQVGHALLALIDAGDALGPPLVLPAAALIEMMDDPREALDLSYQRQLEILTQVRRGVADVATSRKRLELQMNTLQQQITKLRGQAEAARQAGQQDLAGEAQARETAVREQLAGLQRQYAVLAAEEEKLTSASQRLQAKVEAFRLHKETLKASYTAAEASRRIQDAFAEMGIDPAEAGDFGPEVAPSAESVAMGSAATAGETLREGRVFIASGSGHIEAVVDEDVPVPDGLLVLRPGAPGEILAALMFEVRPAGTVALLGYAAASGERPPDYEALIPTAAARMRERAARADAAVPGTGADAAVPGTGAGTAESFRRYDTESFLDEFFPGAETEVEIGAAALIARHRAHTLAEARQRMRMTQVQVAERMNVRQERVSAIERAEPGATEVRTLAAYVRALGGRLEIVAHIGDESILLG
jgi:hypothetical protein